MIEMNGAGLSSADARIRRWACADDVKIVDLMKV